MTVTASLPSGRQIRRWTRHRSRYHSNAGLSELLGDLYTVLLAVVMTVSAVFSLASTLAPDGGPVRPTAAEGPGMRAGWLVMLLAVAAIAALVGLAARFGPLALSAAEASWWLPLPVERRTLLRPAAYRWPLVGAVLGVISGIAVGLACGAGWVSVSAGGVLGIAVAVGLVAVTGLVQTSSGAHLAVRRTADAVLAAVPVAGMLLTVTGWSPPVPVALTVGAALLALGAAIVLVRRWDGRLDAVPAVSLRHRGAAADQALVAVLSLDTRALGRALAARTEPSHRARSLRMPWLTRVPVRRRAAAALISADLLLLRRTPRHLVQVVISACLPMLALFASGPNVAAIAASALIGAYGAALATVEGARRAQVNPALDAMLPLSQGQVRRCRLVLPLAVMLVWSVPLAVVLGWHYGGSAGWITLCLVTAPVWVAGATRAAYRPLPDYSGPLISTPMGALPPGVSAVMAQGPDVALFGSTPLIAALILGTVPPLVLVLQVVLAVGALALVSRDARGWFTVGKVSGTGPDGAGPRDRRGSAAPPG